MEDRFVAFIDILGFSAHVRAAHNGGAISHDDLRRASKLLAGDDRVGPNPVLTVTRISDGALISAEVNPDGLRELLDHCWVTCLNLLPTGLMCRGFVTRGPLDHSERDYYGLGAVEAVEGEKRVKAFAKAPEDGGTPFIEIHQPIIDYINQQDDQGLRDIVRKFTKSDGVVTAIFPYRMLYHPVILAAGKKFDAERERAANEKMRSDLKVTKDRIMSHADMGDAKVARKVAHYLSFLDEALARCDQTDDYITNLVTPPSQRARKT